MRQKPYDPLHFCRARKAYSALGDHRLNSCKSVANLLAFSSYSHPQELRSGSLSALVGFTKTDHHAKPSEACLSAPSPHRACYRLPAWLGRRNASTFCFHSHSEFSHAKNKPNRPRIRTHQRRHRSHRGFSATMPSDSQTCPCRRLIASSPAKCWAKIVLSTRA